MCLWIFVHEFEKMTRGRRNNSSKQCYHLVIHQCFREAKIQFVMLSLKTREVKPDKVISSC